MKFNIMGQIRTTTRHLIMSLQDSSVFTDKSSQKDELYRVETYVRKSYKIQGLLRIIENP